MLNPRYSPPRMPLVWTITLAYSNVVVLRMAVEKPRVGGLLLLIVAFTAVLPMEEEEEEDGSDDDDDDDDDGKDETVDAFLREITLASCRIR